VAGVALSSGEEIAAAQVLSAADPARTLIELVDPGWLGPELVNALRHARRRGVVATVRLTLERRPGVGALTIAPSLAYLERAYDDAKYGRMSERPYVEVCADGASGGRPALELHVQYAPYRLREGAWDDQRRRALGEAAVATLCEHEPELRGAIADVTVHSPVDLEREQGWPEGQAFHVEPALDQILFMRPVPGLARYRTPIRGLYLCGPGTHPGGRIVGASGALAADAALRDGRR
jgi:phytoene dehydrogenase-like protein